MPTPHLLEPVFHSRIWGSTDLRAWYPHRPLEPEPIGEAWLTTPNDAVLIKLLFPQERLSVQVHPDDDYAARHGLGRGKTEAWYVVEASPAARLGIGLLAGTRWEDFGAACRVGRGADLLDWRPARPGDIFYIPAGTIHAVGPDVVLLEVQEPSDVTFRLDDYGRGRPLHLEQGLAVARPTAAAPAPYLAAAAQAQAAVAGATASRLRLASPYFRLVEHRLDRDAVWTSAAIPRWLIDVSPGAGSPALPRGYALAIPPDAGWRWPGGGHGLRTVIEISAPDIPARASTSDHDLTP